MSNFLWDRLMATGMLLAVLTIGLSLFVGGRALQWFKWAAVVQLIVAALLVLIVVWGGVHR